MDHANKQEIVYAKLIILSFLFDQGGNSGNEMGSRCITHHGIIIITPHCTKELCLIILILINYCMNNIKNCYSKKQSKTSLFRP